MEKCEARGLEEKRHTLLLLPPFHLLLSHIQSHTPRLHSYTVDRQISQRSRRSQGEPVVIEVDTLNVSP